MLGGHSARLYIWMCTSVLVKYSYLIFKQRSIRACIIYNKGFLKFMLLPFDFLFLSFIFFFRYQWAPRPLFLFVQRSRDEHVDKKKEKGKKITHHCYYKKHSIHILYCHRYRHEPRIPIDLCINYTYDSLGTKYPYG